ncbi:pantoate--beta-alanine ligase [Candidatus Manganitrophus noduliformans]|uniref:Pantothenate synthetase n=1 Tax=Candidatus Manganitrophus noduliformans TaxID=2606439 RepID=A0A7X6IAI6_9BACT|nr:pantoate--beta-alanine ligase [Candidatus Manganitrophus noduliformans]NKE70521.1 pantoate--beta-alanine ligase [Candidatus Manganitrophus noduliformans]
MKTLSNIKAVQKILAPLRGKKRIGFVPTMGAFHEGHLALMRRAERECDFVVVSLFVNPLQFGPKEDFAAYPRSVPSDRKMAQEAGVDLLWTPTAEEIYPSPYRTFVDVEEITRRWEGAVRPGHFRGVATVVAKLLQVVQPDRAYFGQKDYQQTRVLRQMVKDLHFPVSIRILPTVREKDGVAMSSRNQRLSPAERAAAPILFRALTQAETRVRQGIHESRPLLKEVAALIQSEPLARIDYIALCDPASLEPIEKIQKEAVFLLAVKIGSVRLIDNLLIRI